MNMIPLEVWEPSPENPRIQNCVGMRAAQEVFAELKQRLESLGYLPDEYFNLGIEWENGKEIPAGADLFVTTDYGSSEGIYHVMIDHGGFVTLYAHCSKILVSEGQAVEAGTVIAQVGSTGRSTGNHLHFEVRISGEKQNPRSYLP